MAVGLGKLLVEGLRRGEQSSSSSSHNTPILSNPRFTPTQELLPSHNDNNSSSNNNNIQQDHNHPSLALHHQGLPVSMNRGPPGSIGNHHHPSAPIMTTSSASLSSAGTRGGGSGGGRGRGRAARGSGPGHQPQLQLQPQQLQQQQQLPPMHVVAKKTSKKKMKA